MFRNGRGRDQVALILAIGVSLFVVIAAVGISVQHDPLSEVGGNLLATVLGGMTGAVATYLGLTGQNAPGEGQDGTAPAVPPAAPGDGEQPPDPADPGEAPPPDGGTPPGADAGQAATPLPGAPPAAASPPRSAR